MSTLNNGQGIAPGEIYKRSFRLLVERFRRQFRLCPVTIASMSVSWPTVITSLVASITQVVVAFLAVRLALGRFRQEKWWERKYEAYSEILTALHHMKRDFTDDLERTMSSNGRTPEQKRIFEAAFAAASSNLMRHSDLADFLLSPIAASLLLQFGKRTEAATDAAKSYSEYLASNLEIIIETLQVMRAEAKRDLMERRLTPLRFLGRLEPRAV